MDLRGPAKCYQLTVAICLTLRQMILETEACPLDSLRDLSSWSNLPFPFSCHRLPVDSFRLNQDGAFRFMGRRIFAEVY